MAALIALAIVCVIGFGAMLAICLAAGISVLKKPGLKSKKGLTRAAHWQITRPVLAFSQDILSRIAAYLGAIAQLGERLLCKQEVVGSIPSGSTKPLLHVR